MRPAFALGYSQLPLCTQSGVPLEFGPLSEESGLR